jgi:hypothetical protein
MKQFFSLLSWRLFTAQHVSGVFPPIIRSPMTAVAASGFTFISWWQSCCVRGRAVQPVTCWAVNKPQDNKLKNFCIWLVIYLNWNPLNFTVAKTSYFLYRPVSHNAIFSTPCPLNSLLLGPYYLLNTLWVFWISKKKWLDKYDQRLMR